MNKFFKEYTPMDNQDEEFKNLLEIEKSANKPFYDRQRTEYTQDYNVQKDDLDRLLAYSKSDYARDLANQNKTFSRTLDKKINSFNSRNIIDSGVMRNSINDDTEDFQKTLYNMQDYQKRKEEDIENRKTNLATKYQRGMRDIEENETYRAYMQALGEMQNKQKEYDRQYFETQKNPIVTPTTQTTQRNGGYSVNDLKRKNLGKTKQDEINKNTYKQDKTNKNTYKDDFGSGSMLPGYITGNDFGSGSMLPGYITGKY